MGDRGNVEMVYGEGQSIFFYTHWQGTELPQTVAKALEKGRTRWDDESYLARIIFQEIIGNDDDVTGFGIAPYVMDNEHDVVQVFTKLNVVKIGHLTWPFERYVEAFANA